jgi:hypothetical protein
LSDEEAQDALQLSWSLLDLSKTFPEYI